MVAIPMALQCPTLSMTPVSGDRKSGGGTSLKNDGLDPVGETLTPIATGPSLVISNNEVNIPWSGKK